jgi:hypothetical protein
VRFVATMLLWLVTTLALAVAVPAAWAQQHVIDEDGYVELAQQAATERPLQDAMAGELTSQLVALGADSGYDISPNLLNSAATAYTRSAAFPGQFATANRIVHRWMFTDTVAQANDSGRWEIDLSPMLTDSSFQNTLRDFGISPPSTLVVPLTENVSDSLRPGQLRALGTWGPWAAVGAAVAAGVFALFTLAATRSKGKGLVALGVSALVVGAGGWAGLEVARRYVDEGLNKVTGDIRAVADAMVSHAEGSLHLWLNLTLAAGAALVALGLIVSVLGGWRRSTRHPNQ